MIKPIICIVAFSVLAVAIAVPASAQDAEGDLFSDDIEEVESDTSSEDSSIFDDPFSISGSTDIEESGDFDADIFSDPFGSGDSIDDDWSGQIDDFEDLFQDDMVDEVTNTDEFANPEQELLKSEQVTWGGRIRGNTSLDWSWNSTDASSFDAIDPNGQSLTPSIAADLFVDARPNADFRAFAKLRLQSATSNAAGGIGGVINNVALTGDLPEGWSRRENEDGDTEILDDTGEVVFTVAAESEEETYEPGTGTAPGIDISVYELFADFNYDEKLFFRFGKHTIQWGVGYFFSPADVLNLTSIDPEDATADREGPVSLKVHYPFGLSNLYLYLITNVDARPDEIAVAPKFEFVTGSTEFSLGAYYQRALAPRVIAMFSSSIDDIDLFGEGIVSYGSDAVFVRRSNKSVDDFDSPPEGLETVLDTFTVDAVPIASATLGMRYLKEFEHDLGSFAFIFQYLFNGEGYADSSLLKPAAFLLQNTDTNGLLIADEAQQPEGYEDPPELRVSDLTGSWGRHYIGATASWSKIANTDFSFSIFGLMNLSDLSGIVSPSIQFPFLDSMSASIGGRLTFGNDGDEFTNPAALFNGDDEITGGTFSLTLSVGLTGGGF